MLWQCQCLYSFSKQALVESSENRPPSVNEDASRPLDHDPTLQQTRPGAAQGQTAPHERERGGGCHILEKQCQHHKSQLAHCISLDMGGKKKFQRTCSLLWELGARTAPLTSTVQFDPKEHWKANLQSPATVRNCPSLLGTDALKQKPQVSVCIFKASPSSALFTVEGKEAGNLKAQRPQELPLTA